MQKLTYLNNVNYKSNNQINYLAGGINNIYPPENIADDEVQDMYNMCLDNYPAIRTRIGRTMVRNPGLKGDPIKYFGVAGVKYLFYIQGNQLKDMTGTVIANGITGTKFNHVYYADGNQEYMILYGEGVTPTRHKLPLSSINTPEIVPLPTYQETIEKLATSIQEAAQEEGKEISYEDALAEAKERLTDDFGAITNFEHMCYHKNRMIASVGNMLFFSALQNPMDWTSTENSREDRVENCNQITGLVSFDDKLIVFSQKNMHLYYGSNVIAGETNSYTCVTLDNNIGCYDQCTIKVHNSYLYWLYGRSIYEYDGSTIRTIDRAESNNGMTGGIREYLEGITINEAKNVSVAGSEDKVYFWFPDYKYFLIFDQRLRKWTKELQPDNVADELYYTTICDSYADLNFSQTPQPVYALTANGTIYELTGGRKDGTNYIRTYGEDEFTDNEDVVYKEQIPFYLKTKEFKNGVISKKIQLSKIWFFYDLAEGGKVDIKILADNGKKVHLIENALLPGQNMTEVIQVPNDMQNVNSYTFEISGLGDFRLRAMERVDRTNPR